MIVSTRSATPSQQRGFSVTELVVSMGLLSVISLIFFGVYVGLLRQSVFMESHNDMTTEVEVALNKLRWEIVQSRMIFQNDTSGNAYKTALQFPTTASLLANSKLPTIDTNGVFGADTSTNNRTGNILFLARELKPLELPLDHDGDASTADISYLTDNYRFRVYYLSQNGSRPFMTQSKYVDLILAESPIFADYFQLSGLTAAQKTQLVKELYAAGVKKAWDPSKAVASALFDLHADGSTTGPTSAAIPIESWSSAFPQFKGGAVSGAVDYTVGIEALKSNAKPDVMPYYAIESGKFPSGLEIQMIGPTGARKVMCRLLTMAHHQLKVNTVASSVTAATAQF